MITLICGHLGCGKTTYARKMNIRRLSVDETMLQRYPPYLGDAHEAIAAQVKAELLEEAARSEEDIVLDWGFPRRSERDAVREYFATLGKEVRFLWLDIPDDEVQRRREYRNANLPPDAYFIDENLARKCDGMFEPPEADEHMIRITE